MKTAENLLKHLCPSTLPYTSNIRPIGKTTKSMTRWPVRSWPIEKKKVGRLFYYVNLSTN